MNAADRTNEQAMRDSKRARKRDAANSKRALTKLASSIRRAYPRRASKNAGTWVRAGRTPALVVKVHGGSKHGDGYSERQAGAMLISTNALTNDAKGRLQEWRIEELRHPGVRPDRLIFHISLSRPANAALEINGAGGWKEVISMFCEEAGIRGLFAATLHTNTKHQHAHLVFSRSQPGGSLWSDSNSFWTLRAAAQRVTKRLKIEIDDTAPKPTTAPTDAAVSALRRSQHRGTPAAWVKPDLIKNALQRSRSMKEFKALLASQKIEFQLATRDSDGQVTGALFRASASEEWLSGSSISRELTLPMIQRQLELNAAARAPFAGVRPPAPVPGQRPVHPAPPRQRGG